MSNGVIGRKLLGAAAFTASLTAAGGCTEPEIRHPNAITVVSGGGQEGEVGAPLPLDVEVRVTDIDGRTVRRVPITFEILTGATPGFTSGSVAPVTTETDRSGVARTRWTLGTAAGQQTLRARIGSEEGAANLFVDVSATAQPGIAASLTRVSEPIVAITVGDSVRVAVVSKDRYGNTTSAISELTWRVVDAAVASVSRTELPPDRAAMVRATAKGATVLEVRDAAGHSVSFDLRTYVGPGRDIAYESNGSIYLLSADGATTTPLGPGRDPAWSPDGRRIAFTGNAGTSGPSSFFPGAAIYVMNADGSGRRALTDPATLPGASQPTWSPDGRKIAFVAPSDDPGDPRRPAALFVMNTDGSVPTRVLRTLALCSISCPGIRHPAWSPDGTRIAYSILFLRSSGSQGDVFVVNADGSGDQALASTGGIEDEAAWSPDGKRVAFESSATVPSGTETPYADLYAVNVDGTGGTRLTAAASIKSLDVAPSWSPDHRIAFLRVRTFPSVASWPGELWVVNGDGTEARRVASFPSGIARPAWRPTP